MTAVPAPSIILDVVVLVAVAFAVYCFVDLVRAAEVRYLPKWLWGIIICITIPLGGIVYLVVGKRR
ncbi:MAG: PLDc N-terminal domain-containing protein [Acidimicrobiales bacterium]